MPLLWLPFIHEDMCLCVSTLPFHLVIYLRIGLGFKLYIKYMILSYKHNACQVWLQCFGSMGDKGFDFLCVKCNLNYIITKWWLPAERRRLSLSGFLLSFITTLGKVVCVIVPSWLDFHYYIKFVFKVLMGIFDRSVIWMTLFSLAPSIWVMLTTPSSKKDKRNTDLSYPICKYITLSYFKE